jgi:starch phosphorylase
MKLFSQGEYIRAMQQNTSAEIISKVLYPSDEHTEGKLLRLTQQYFLVSASLQSVIADHFALYGTLNNFADKVAIHINDTHPALCIPELMRILLDVYSYSWEDAWNIVTRTISYTNHTVMPEALETWNEDLFRLKLPRIYMIICEINRRLGEELWRAYPGDWERISQMSVISHSQIRMANLSVYASHKVNGVSELHTQILKDTVFHNSYKYTPEKFINITNGIAHRRWLCCANPELATLLDETIGPEYRYDSERLSDFAKYSNDKNIHERLSEIKQHNKERFAEYYYLKTGIALNTHSIFDVHVKRIHEYKRQLLGALKIIAYYNELKEKTNSSIKR